MNTLQLGQMSLTTAHALALFQHSIEHHHQLQTCGRCHGDTNVRKLAIRISHTCNSLLYTYISTRAEMIPKTRSPRQASAMQMHIYNPSRSGASIKFPSYSQPTVNAKGPFLFQPILVHVLSCQSLLALSASIAQSSKLDIGFSSNHFSNVWYMTSIVPLCTLVHTPLGPTPLNQPATPSVR